MFVCVCVHVRASMHMCVCTHAIAHACVCVCVCGVTENNLDAKVDVRIAKASKAFGALRNSCYL